MTLVLALLLALDLASVKAEPNHERRAELAVKFANDSLTEAHEAETAGNDEKFKAKLSDIEAAADLCRDSLDASGKSARRSPKHFKRAELQLRELMRRLKTLSDSSGFENRERIDAVERKVAAVRDHILEEIMMKK